MNWLQEIFDRLLSIFPRILILVPYEMGMRFTFGYRSRKLKPGWYVYWPLIQRIVFMEVQTQFVDLRTQSAKTSNGKDIIVSGAVQFRINDIEKAIVKIQMVDDSLEILALGVILDFINTKEENELQNIEALKTELLKEMREAAAGWGVKIEKIYITDIGHTRNLRLLLNPFMLGENQ